MLESIQQLIVALREELQQYGEMLALLDRQQQLVVIRAGAEVFQSVGQIQGQATVILGARVRREECRRQAARKLGRPEETLFTDLIPLLPAEYRPLVKALVDENNELLVRVQQRARQNHLLLSRSLELMQGMLNSLFPASETRVYNGHGGMQTHAGVPRTLYEGVG
jgi:flagellar biosynthesis/type III secretory pathway chaperone